MDVAPGPGTARGSGLSFFPVRGRGAGRSDGARVTVSAVAAREGREEDGWPEHGMAGWLPPTLGRNPKVVIIDFRIGFPSRSIKITYRFGFDILRRTPHNIVSLLTGRI